VGVDRPRSWATVARVRHRGIARRPTARRHARSLVPGTGRGACASRSRAPYIQSTRRTDDGTDVGAGRGGAASVMPTRAGRQGG
jgi:hypothetical protein